MKFGKCAFVILLLTLLAAAPMSVPAVNSQQYDTILVIPSATPSSFNPLMTFRDIGLARDWIYILYEPLTLVLNNGTILPWLAKSYEIKDNGTKYVFRIDERARWSDGTPVTAYDVEFTWNLSTTLAGGVRPNAILQQVVAVDDYTVEFRTRVPYAYWMYAYGQFMPIPKHIWSQIPDPMSYDFIWNPENHVTSSAFLYDSYEEGQWYFFRTRPDYWKTESKPRIDGILRRVMMDLTMQVTSLLAGDIDLMEVGVDILPQVEGQPGISIYKYIPAASDHIAINTRFYPLNMKEVRRAIDLAIDKKKIAEDYFWGQAVPANKSQINFALCPEAFVPEAVWPGFYKSHAECVAEANQILDSLGFTRGPDGIRVTPNGTRLSYTLIHEILFMYRMNAAEEIVKNLREIGIEANLQSLNLFEWLVLTLFTDEQLAAQGLTRYWGFSHGCFGEYPEPWYDLVWNYISYEAGMENLGLGTGALCSGTGWRNEECDRYGIQALLSLNKDEFYRNVREMVRITADELPVVSTVWWTMTMFAYRTDKLVNWDWDSCTKTPIWGHPLVIRPMTTHKLTPIKWVPPATPTPTPTPTPRPTPPGPTPTPTPTPTGPTPTGPRPTPTPTPVVTPTPTPTAAPAGMPTEQIILIAVVVIIVIAVIGYLVVRARKKAT
ncbi:MAG: ABC transporter substrate-binding protein [Nitrososphaerota archaeon]|nr:ABC transporter substrate-binding protein [Nitrososphaerota archaeon]